jgi:hypothetical protein
VRIEGAIGDGARGVPQRFEARFRRLGDEQARIVVVERGHAARPLSEDL